MAKTKKKEVKKKKSTVAKKTVSSPRPTRAKTKKAEPGPSLPEIAVTGKNIALPEKEGRPVREKMKLFLGSREMKFGLLLLVTLLAFWGIYWGWKHGIHRQLLGYLELMPEDMLTFLAQVPVILAAIVALIAGKLFYQFTLPFSLPQQLTQNDNPAVGLTLSGFLVGLGLALVGATYGLKAFPQDALLNIGIGLLVSAPLLRLSGIIQDRSLLHKFSVMKEIKEDRNLGTGAICCGGFIGTGLILMGSFIGESMEWYYSLVSLLSAYLVGQIVFLLGGILYRKIVRYDFHHEIEERDNVSAGIILGSLLVGLGLVVSASVAGISSSDGFQVPLSHRTSLNEGLFAEALRKDFEDRTFSLSQETKVEVSHKDQKWTVVDEGKKRHFLVTREEESLKIHTGFNWKSLLEQLAQSALIGMFAILVLLGAGMIAAKLIFPRVSLDEEVKQKNPAVALIIAAVYLTVAFITYSMLRP